MMDRIEHLWQHHRWLLFGFCAALFCAGFFGFNAAADWIYWNDPAHHEQAIEGWMTPRYVSNSYKIPPRELADALFLNPEEPFRRVTMATIATDNGITLDALQDRIDAADAAWEATRPRNTP